MLLKTEKLVTKFLPKQSFLARGFCQAKNRIQALQLKKQKAELSFEIFNLILKKPHHLDLRKKSLHDLIIEKIYQKNNTQSVTTFNPKEEQTTCKKDHKTFKYHEQVRKPFIDLFEKGFEIDEEIFSQQRIEDGNIKIGNKSKFIFHPTYFITSQVFNELNTLNRMKKIITGHFGISKTVSVCLFWHLVKFIDQYRFFNGVKVSQEMMQIPKIVYCTIAKNIESTQNNMKNIIIDQCPEIKEKYKLTDGSKYDWQLSTIKKFYSNNFPGCIVIQVIDQINYVAQIGRLYYEEIKKAIQQSRKNQNYIKQLKNKHVKNFFQIKQEIQFCVSQFHGILGLSSMNFQAYLFELIQLATATNSFSRPISQIKYSQQIYIIQSLIQLADYYIFQMNQRIFTKLTSNKVSNKNQKELIKLCLEIMQQKVKKKQFFFFTPYDIRQFILNQQNNVKQFDKMKIQQFKDFVIDRFKNLIMIKTQNYQKLLLNHFSKQDQKDVKRTKLMLQIYQYLAIKGKNEIQRQINNTISRIPIKKLSFSRDQINQLLDKRLFQYDEGALQIKLMLPSSLIIQFIKPRLKSELNIYAQVMLQYANKNRNKLNIGNMVEFHFLQALNIGNIQFSFKTYNQKIQGQVREYNFKLQEQNFTFQHLQKTSKSNPNHVSILQRFQQTIKIIKQKQLTNAVVFPVKKNYKQIKKQERFDVNDVVPNSKLIDLALIQNIKRQNIISIWLVDLTISKSQIRPKIHAFISEFLKFSDKNITFLTQFQGKPHVQINYIVLGPKNGIYHQDFSNVLKKDFGHQITLNTLQKSNVFIVDKLENSTNSLLQRVGYIELDSNFNFGVKNQINVKYLQVLKGLFKQI